MLVLHQGEVRPQLPHHRGTQEPRPVPPRIRRVRLLHHRPHQVHQDDHGLCGEEDKGEGQTVGFLEASNVCF